MRSVPSTARPTEPGRELLVLSAAPGSPAEDGLRLLGALDGNRSGAHPPVEARTRD